MTASPSLHTVSAPAPMVQALSHRAHADPDRLALVFIADAGSEETVTVAQLHADALAAAHTLQANGITAGDVVLVSLPHSRALIAAFWGALYLGAVPSILPSVFASAETTAHRDHLQTLALQAQARLVVTSPAVAEQLGSRLSHVPYGVLGVEGNFSRDISSPSDSWQPASGTQLTYIQYTSGTTGTRRGVALSHAAIVRWIHAFARRLDIGPTDVVVNWLPLYHDFGLFAGLLMPIVYGIPTVLLSPFKVLRKPEALLWAIHQHKGTLSWITNTGYSLLAQRVRDQHVTGLDLSHLRVLGCGGEPVRYGSQQRFLQRFEPYGLRENALVTGYGMAETVMADTVSSPRQRAPIDWIESSSLQSDKRARACRPDTPGAQPLVSCGTPLEGAQVEVVDEHEQLLPDRHIGEVRVRTTFLFDEYYRQPEATAQVLRNGWLYTGDLGYVADHHLYICGRKKDLIIVGGRNIHPEEVEAVAERAAGTLLGRVVAFGLDDERLGTEQIVLVCGLERSLDEDQQPQFVQTVRLRVLQELDVAVADVRLVRRSWIEVTTSGKVARAANKQKYLAAGFRPTVHTACVAQAAANRSPAELEQLVLTICAEFLPLPHINLHDNFLELGLDSLLLVELILLIEEEVGKPVPIDQLMTHPTPARLVQLLSPPAPAPHSPRPRHAPSPNRQPTPFTRWRQAVKQAGGFRRAMLQQGPAFRQTILPYGLGSRLLHYLVQQPRLRQALYRHEIALLQRCLEEQALPVSPEYVLQQSLVVNTWPVWRFQALQQRRTFARWVTVRGSQIFDQAAQDGRGVVVAFPHSQLKKVIRHYGRLQQGGMLTIGNIAPDRLDHMGLPHLANTIRRGAALPQTALRTAQFYRAQHELTRGNVVLVLADALAGRGGVSVSFHGRVRPLRPGIAELALRTEALLIPAFASLEPSGQVTIEFCDPLVPESGSHQVQVESLLHQYAVLLSSWWSTQMGNMEWEFLRQFLRFPRASG